VLSKNRSKLASAWPTDLRATTETGIERHIRFKSGLRIPDDHVARLLPDAAESLARRLKQNERRLLAELGLDTDKAILDFAKEQVKRIKPFRAEQW
jgi:hypothetical protein